MDPHAITTTAQEASQVGLLTWLVVAIALFSGSLVFTVIYQNGKREERYAKLVEVNIANLGDKMESYKEIVKEKMGIIEQSNRMVKEEHTLMINSLSKVSETLIALAAIIKRPHTNDT